MTQYECDHCKKIYRTDENLIFLGSEGNDLKYKNPKSKPGETCELARYCDLHFCDKNCFVNYFFGKENIS